MTQDKKLNAKYTYNNWNSGAICPDSKSRKKIKHEADVDIDFVISSTYLSAIQRNEIFSYGFDARGEPRRIRVPSRPEIAEYSGLMPRGCIFTQSLPLLIGIMRHDLFGGDAAGDSSPKKKEPLYERERHRYWDPLLLYLSNLSHLLPTSLPAYLPTYIRTCFRMVSRSPYAICYNYIFN
jgi:hypothetical protein